MHQNRRRGAGRGVSPVVGTVLLLAIVIALAGIFAAMLSGVGDSLVEPAPTIVFEADYAPSGDGNGGVPYVNLTHRGGDIGDGDSIVIRDDSGNTVRWSAIWTAGAVAEFGEYAHIDGKGSDGELDRICEAGQTYTVVHQDSGRGAIILEYEVPTDPTPVPASC